VKSILRFFNFIQLAALFILALTVAAVRLDGHAVLKSSSPAAGSVVAGPDVPVTLTFNVRVDAARSGWSCCCRTLARSLFPPASSLLPILSLQN
jgi:methionine-rich copper-binding protein CopC